MYDWRADWQARFGRTEPKIVCVGLNYRNHILEMGRDLPEHPTLFSKYADTLIGAHDEIHRPVETDAFDWEAELTVVIGKTVRRADEQQAADARHGEAERAQYADLAHPLLHAKLEEEARQQQGRNHQEEAEVDEVLSEIGRAARGAQRFFADAAGGESVARGVERFSQARGERGVGRRDAQRTRAPVARAP